MAQRSPAYCALGCAKIIKDVDQNRTDHETRELLQDVRACLKIQPDLKIEIGLHI